MLRAMDLAKLGQRFLGAQVIRARLKGCGEFLARFVLVVQSKLAESGDVVRISGLRRRSRELLKQRICLVILTKLNQGKRLVIRHCLGDKNSRASRAAPESTAPAAAKPATASCLTGGGR